MSSSTFATLAAAAVVSAVAFAAPSANAAPACKPAVEASAAGLGALGRGSRRAHIKAQSNWSEKVSGLYGDRFSRFALARGVVWNCKGGTLAPATCTVRARPCAR